MKKLSAQIIIRLVALTAALGVLSSAGIAGADWDETVSRKQPFYGVFKEVTVDGRWGFEINFSLKVIDDKELIFKQLAEEERPFRLSRPADLKVFWKSDRILRLEPEGGPDALEAGLEEKHLDLIWAKNFKALGPGPEEIYLERLWNSKFKAGEELLLQYVSPAGDSISAEVPALIFNASKKLKSGETYNRLELSPFKAEVTYGADYADPWLKLQFNRLMVPADKVGQSLDLAEAPITLEPALPMKGSWRNQRAVVFSNSFRRAEFLEKISDVQFLLKWKSGLENTRGRAVQPAPAEREIYFSRFKNLGFDQSAMNLDGWAEFDLAFNKPVTLEEVGRRVAVDKSVYATGRAFAADKDEKSTAYRPALFQVRPFEGPDDDGTVVKIRVKADHGERLRIRLNGLTSADGRGELKNEACFAVVDRLFTLARAELEMEENYPWRSYFTIETREDLKFDDIEKFIRLDPPLEFTVSPYGQEGRSIQIFAGFKPGQPTTVTLLRGLASQRGVLTEDVSYTVRPPKDLPAKLMFTGRGRYLSPGKPLLVKLAGRGVEKARLQAWRVYENNLAAIINIQDYDEAIRLRLAQQFSDNLLDRETDTRAPAGLTFERLIDLGTVLDEKPKGAYILKCSPVKKKEARSGDDDDEDYEYYNSSYYDYEDYYSYPERYLPVMISDLGLAAHVLPGRVSVWVNSLSAARPVAEAEVKLYNRANQVIAEGRTDAGGLYSGEAEVADLVFATVEKDGDLNYLTFGQNSRSGGGSDYDDDYDDYGPEAWQEDGNAKWYGGDGGYLPVEAPDSPFGPMRSYLTRGYEAFVYMPRDIFKPGETVRVKAVIRDKNILPPAETFPVLWTIKDPDSRVLSQGRADLDQHGSIDFAGEIPFSARTGSYLAEVSLPGSTAVLGGAKFTVEDFVPPRLSLEVRPRDNIYRGDNPEITLESEAKYLFGAPGAELNWELDAVIFPSAFNPKGWEGFDFNGYVTDFQSTSQRRAVMGRLDEQGRVLAVYRPGLAADRLPNKTSIEFVFSVQEDGGRWNAKKARVDYFPRELILGAKAPDSARIDQPFKVQLAAVTPEGRAALAPELSVRVFRVMTRYYNSYRYGRHYRQSVEELVDQASLLPALSEGRGEVSFTPAAAGAYELHVLEPVSGQSFKKRVRVYGMAAEQEAAPARGPVELSFDREFYRPGETAAVKVRSPFPGHLWLTVETTETLYSVAARIADKELELKIPVDAAIKTNAQVTATVVRPVDAGARVFRAVGVKSLEVDRDIYRLKVQAEMPKHVKPSSKVKLKIRLADYEGRALGGQVSVALVDEGVLSLTGFKTPEPGRLFTAGRRLVTRFYDLYEQLLPLEPAAVPFLTPGGGDGLGRSGLFSPFKRNQEILSIFLASVEVQENGEAEVELDIPEYSGQGRLMVVASSRDKFGSTAADIRVSRNLTTEATLPLALAPGDSFESPVRVFLAAEAPDQAGRGAAINFRTEGPIRVIGRSEAEFQLEPGQGRTVVLQLQAEPGEEGGDLAGPGRLIIDSRDGAGDSFSQTVETVVRPPYPRATKTIAAQLVDRKTDLTIASEGFLPGTVEAALSLAANPAIEAARAVSFLRSYPYGCLEQTTSKAWVFVAAEDLMAGLEPDSVDGEHIEAGLRTAAQRLATMQTPSGGFATWPGGNEVYEWGTVYAAHFLTEAEKQIELPRGLKEKALAWLERYLGAGYGGSGENAAYILSTRAYASFVLALNGRYQAAWVNALKERTDGLSPSARIFLAGAQAVKAGNSRALVELEKEKTDPGFNTLRQRVSSLDSAPRNLALKLMVWTEVDPLSETARDLAFAVADQGRQGRWSNTQENGLAALALGRYLTKSGLGLPYRVAITDPAGRIIYQGGHRDFKTVGPGMLASALDQKLKIEVEGQGRPYYSLLVGGVPLTPPEPVAENIRLSRVWTLEDETQWPLDDKKDLEKELTVAKGDRVVVTLEVRADEPVQNLVLVDILPGGFEIENPRLVQPEDREGEEGNDDNDDEEVQYSSRLELREDRLVIIEPWIAGGVQRYQYTMRAVTTGRYVLPGTLAEGMYEPDRKAILAGGRVTVR